MCHILKTISEKKQTNTLNLSTIINCEHYNLFLFFILRPMTLQKAPTCLVPNNLIVWTFHLYRLTWGLVYLVFIAVVTVVTVFLASVSGFFTNSNTFLFFLILLFYGLSIISLAFVITPFFNKAQSAGGLASLATMLFSCLYLIISLTRKIKEDGTVTYSIPPVARGFMCLISPCAVSIAIDQVTFSWQCAFFI